MYNTTLLIDSTTSMVLTDEESLYDNLEFVDYDDMYIELEF